MRQTPMHAHNHTHTHTHGGSVQPYPELNRGRVGFLTSGIPTVVKRLASHDVLHPTTNPNCFRNHKIDVFDLIDVLVRSMRQFQVQEHHRT